MFNQRKRPKCPNDDHAKELGRTFRTEKFGRTFRAEKPIRQLVTKKNKRQQVREKSLERKSRPIKEMANYFKALYKISYLK